MIQLEFDFRPYAEGALMNDKLEELARSFLLEASSDESWIDASSGFTKKKLMKVLAGAQRAALEALQRNAPACPHCLGTGMHPVHMDASGAPTCWCGRPSAHQSGWCGECAKTVKS